MGRARRVDVGGMIYHALNRANFRSWLFRTSEEWVLKAVAQFGLENTTRNRGRPSKNKARVGGTPTRPAPAGENAGCAPPSPPRGRGTFISVGEPKAHAHSKKGS
jgi:hypothetical protein